MNKETEFFWKSRLEDMQIDMFGKRRYKVNLHMHTTLSDGHRSPGEAVQLYQRSGYDAIALTDHWFYGEGEESPAFTVLSGAEYNLGGADSREGVWHIVCVGTQRPPSVAKTMSPQGIVDAIHRAGGLAILAHPAWSLNSPEEIRTLRDLDGIEIYNSVSGVHMSRRADSSLIVDMLAMQDYFAPLHAADDTHYYDGTDECLSWIMVEAEENSPAALLPAIRAGRFYATQGPEVHLFRDGDSMVVRCSPCSEILFRSNLVWSRCAFTGKDLCEARYRIRGDESFLRAEVVDADGKHAWTNCIPLKTN